MEAKLWVSFWLDATMDSIDSELLNLVKNDSVNP